MLQNLLNNNSNIKIFKLLLQNNQQYNFSNNIASSFKQKSKLTEFYKHVHPDILGNAPEKVREENLRSLKNLNAYLDQLSQNKGVQDQALNFYCGEKSNNKSKKFYYFQVRLPALRPESPKEILQKHMEQSIQILLGGIKQTQEAINPYFKKSQDKLDEMQKKQNEQIYSSDFQNLDPKKAFKEKFQYDITHIPKEDNELQKIKKAYIQNRRSNQLFKNVMRNRNDDLLKNIQNELYTMDTPKNKPLMWSKIILNDSGYLKNMHQIFNQLIDPRLIFINEKLGVIQIEQFKEKFVHNEKKDAKHFMQHLRALQNVFQDMESQSPQIALYVSDKYSFEDIPGFFSIPYNFDALELEDYYSENRQKIIQSRKYFEDVQIKLKKLEIDLQDKMQLKDIIILPKHQQEFYNEKKNQQQQEEVTYSETLDILEDNFLFLKKIQKLFSLVQNQSQIVQFFKNKILVLGGNTIKFTPYEIHLNYKFDIEKTVKLLKQQCI